METVASKISGSAGLSGMDSVQLKHHLLQHGGASKNYARWWRKLLAGWPILIIPGGQLIELSYTRLVALEKNTGIRPIGIGDIWRRFFAKCILSIAGPSAKGACGSDQLCAGLSAGIEGAIHGMSQL